ncbi:MFS family permease [Deinobacterium chartae]|uniref:MFS family permease n=1 Tax=Deinobacterium chartae TaxID=521158 RepID=A0A841HYZ1_9DEIO|nr:MFS family permease [Deinobacterium chartae]
MSAPFRGFRTFLTVWATQSLSVFGSAVMLFAVNLWLAQTLFAAPEQQPQLALTLTLVNLAYGLPFVFLAPLAGVWVDRYDRGRIMFVANLGSGVISLLMAAAMATGALSPTLLVLAMLVLACLGTCHGLALDASYVHLVEESDLARANAMMQTTESLSRVLSPALAAAVVALPALAAAGTLPAGLNQVLSGIRDGAVLALALDGVSFLVAALPLLWLRIPGPERKEAATPERRSLWADALEGVRFLRGSGVLLALLAMFALVNVCTWPIGLFETLLVKTNLEADAASRGIALAGAMATITTAVGAGGVISGLVVSAWGGLRRRRILGMLLPILVLGLALATFGASRELPLSAVAMFLIGAMIPISNAHSRALWQTQVPRELQGRVFALRRMVAQASGPISLAVIGWLSGLVAPGAIAVALGGFLAFFALLQLFNPVLMRVDELVPHSPVSVPKRSS